MNQIDFQKTKKIKSKNPTFHNPNKIYDKDLPIPVETEGYWVKRNDFEREKSFGYFVCTKCKKNWLSAHSFKKYKQGCKGCEKKYYPQYLWYNVKNRERNPEFAGINKEKPHDKMRCEACHLGICLERLTL